MDKNSLSQHISTQFNQELEDIRTRVMEMGGLVEQQLASGLTAFVEGDQELAEQVVINDRKVNAFDVSIDEECTTVLVRRQPAAGDLRLVMAVIKTITDLERIADEAKRIARLAIHDIPKQPTESQLTQIFHLGEHVKSMVHNALDAFARMDTTLSLEVSRNDQKVDREYESILRQLSTYMMEDPRSIPTTINILWCARTLERIGDRACNICEYTIYLVKGKDVRHISLNQVEKALK